MDNFALWWYNDEKRSSKENRYEHRTHRCAPGCHEQSHGPCALKGGGWLWVGRVFSADDSFGTGFNYVQAYYVTPDGTMEKRGEIPNIFEDGKLLHACEPHVIELSDGKLVTHIRVQSQGYFSTYQSESTDGGKTWETDHVIWENPLTPDLGYPATVELKDGSLLTVFYAHEKEGEPAVILQQKWKIQ